LGRKPNLTRRQYPRGSQKTSATRTTCAIEESWGVLDAAEKSDLAEVADLVGWEGHVKLALRADVQRPELAVVGDAHRLPAIRTITRWRRQRGTVVVIERTHDVRSIGL